MSIYNLVSGEPDILEDILGRISKIRQVISIAIRYGARYQFKYPAFWPTGYPARYPANLTRPSSEILTFKATGKIYRI